MKRLMLRSWRVTEAVPSGCHVWFDPSREELLLYARDPQPEDGVREVREGDDWTEDRLEQLREDEQAALDLESGLPF